MREAHLELLSGIFVRNIVCLFCKRGIGDTKTRNQMVCLQKLYRLKMCRQSLGMFLIADQLGICYDNLIEFLCQMEEYHEKKTSFKGTYDQR
ncbi:hypothetical protein [Faecalimonas umbilicata]|uniref:hypothetical protein n=1 Tax=Faecalimonas umbilicata TaxID=1912855 RepID=UPI0022E5CFC5|nr:hypothetical protein [Faecalimonas umbilicata]